ncbi:MAG: folate family ECF transporter S component [Tissierellales bacterium]|nr:folate family ECF transporter S component [Tissierellales bacterium]
MEKKKNKISLAIMVRAGFLVAISIVMTRFAYVMLPVAGVGALRISFGEVPLMISGVMFGPMVGALTGIAADLIGFLINPQGPYYPGFTLSSALWGIIPGLFVIYFKSRKNDENIYSFNKMLIIAFVTTIIVSVLLNTLWLSQLFGRGFMVLLPTRLIASIINIPIYAFVISYLMKYLKQFANLD